MESPMKRVLAAALLVVLSLGVTACGSRRGPHYSHGHYHDYRHGYYNPVDGYFHDDHWHRNARNRHTRHVHHKGCGHAASYHYY